MDKIADFIYWLNKTKPRTKRASFQAVWKQGIVKARLEVDYKTEVRLDVLPAEIENGDPESLAVEFAERMEGIYTERMAMPLVKVT